MRLDRTPSLLEATGDRETVVFGDAETLSCLLTVDIDIENMVMVNITLNYINIYIDITKLMVSKSPVSIDIYIIHIYRVILVISISISRSPLDHHWRKYQSNGLGQHYYGPEKPHTLFFARLTSFAHHGSDPSLQFIQHVCLQWR